MSQPRVFAQLAFMIFLLPTFVLPIIPSGSIDGLPNVVNFHASQLLNHSYLVQYPLNITINSVKSLNTLNLCNGVIIEEATIDDLQRYLSDGKLTSVQLTTCYIHRVFQVEKYIK